MTKSTPMVISKLTQSSISAANASVGNMIPQGQYSLAFLNSTLSPMKISMSKSSIGFTGCNSYVILFKSCVNNGTITFSPPITTTTKKCPINNDVKYLSLLTRANGYLHHQNDMYLTSFGKKIGQFKKIHFVNGKSLKKNNKS
jgi:hypothetical protein